MWPDMVVAARIDAARNLDLEVADLALALRRRRTCAQISCASGIERALASAQKSRPGHVIMSVISPALPVASSCSTSVS